MAKKNKSSKKHRFKYAEPTALGGVVTQTPVSSPVTASPGKASVVGPAAGASATVATRDFGYVTRDLRRLGVLAVGLVLLEVMLWYLFNYTGLGDSVYQLVQV